MERIIGNLDKAKLKLDEAFFYLDEIEELIQEDELDEAAGSKVSQATERLTGEKTDVFRTAIAEDSQARVWAVWSQRSGSDWNLVARCLDQGRWKQPARITAGHAPNIFHRFVASRDHR